MRSPTVFLVDAFPDERDMYEEYLVLAGFETHAFDRPERALEAIRTRPPDAVVTRIRQSRSAMDGIALTESLRASAGTRNAAVVVITSSIATADHDAARRAGCDACLVLPLLPDDLAGAVRRALRARTLEGVNRPPAARAEPKRRGRDSA